MKRILWLCLALNLSGTQAGELFRWIDANGKVHYGDAVPPNAAQIERKKFPNGGTPNVDTPYETKLAQQNFPVVLYTADSCTMYCEMGRSLLSKRGIPFSEKKLKSKAEMDDFKTLSGGDTVPTLGVGRHYLSGYLEDQWQRELDASGYPKKPPYRAPGTLPASAPTD